ncbi:uncharacterized protein LOC126978178 [Leptidea sinapis]|uniref:uncharacterized protein LOC126978178 n=1 Tax=Leptidea sinapis TaxID=189913 RepID=UPI0021335F3A|nr:uncharacterized protein LOC126978178 [Leptidea sinapis]
MASVRRSIWIGIKCAELTRAKKNSIPLVSCLSTDLHSRSVYTKSITKEIHHISNTDKELDSGKLDKLINRPTCIILNWLLASRKAVMKYADLYLAEGFDVITVNCRPWQLVWPKRGAQVIGMDLLKVMASSDVTYVVHGFSVGGYVWSEAMVQAMKDSQRYQPVLDRVKAQVWDSPADITEVPVGIPWAMFPNNRPAQLATRAFIKLYLKAFYNIATVHYERACNLFYRTPCTAPGLFLLSSKDPVGKEERIRRACDIWISMGIKCTLQCWPDSPHVLHYLKHQDEYVALVRKHLHDNVKEPKQLS